MQNEEEAWLHHAVKQFDNIVCSHKYGPLFYELLSNDAQLILNNMYVLKQRKQEIKIDYCV
jgi:hypothetical protein